MFISHVSHSKVKSRQDWWWLSMIYHRIANHYLNKTNSLISVYTTILKWRNPWPWSLPQTTVIGSRFAVTMWTQTLAVDSLVQCDARLTVTFLVTEHNRRLTGTKLQGPSYCLVTDGIGSTAVPGQDLNPVSYQQRHHVRERTEKNVVGDSRFVNPLKRSGVRRLHFDVFNAIQV